MLKKQPIIQDYETRFPESLEESQDFMLACASDVKQIWGQLQNEDLKKKKMGEGKDAYTRWENSAYTAYEAKQRILRELRAYAKKKWGFEFSTLDELRNIVLKRSIAAPDWLDGQSAESVSETAHPAIQQIGLPLLDETEHETNGTGYNPFPISAEAEAALMGILERIKQARKAAGVSRDEAGEYCSVKGHSIANWELGKAPITLVNILRLCQLYGVDPVYILLGEMPMNKATLENIADVMQSNAQTIYRLIGGNS